MNERVCFKFAPYMIVQLLIIATWSLQPEVFDWLFLWSFWRGSTWSIWGHFCNIWK